MYSRPEPYYGRKIGEFPSVFHNVTVSINLIYPISIWDRLCNPHFLLQGVVYAVDETTLFIKGFDYDGMAPDAYFWVGVTKQPSPEGSIVPYPENYEGQ